MKVIDFSPEALQEALAVIRDGGVVAHATETCYGLACDMANPEAVQKLFSIKQRPEHQPVSALFSSINQAKEYVAWNDQADTLAQKYLPGPLTLILPMRVDAPQLLHPIGEAGADSVRARGARARTLGVRISSHPHAHALALAYKSPISTTSANVHGQKNPYSAEDIAAQFADLTPQPDLILDSGTLPHTPPSTVIDCTAENLTQKRAGDVDIKS